MAPPELVVISGFTAAGKTTHARLLARDLGWKYIGMSQLRSRLIPVSSTALEEWRAEGDAARAADSGLDRQMDRRMAEIIAAYDTPLVVDAWLQPWLCRAPHAVRVWLGSSFESRVLKANVTHLRSGRIAHAKTRAEISAKDRFSVQHFKRLYGIRFFPDHDIFDLVIDNSPYITEASVKASDQGIQEFHPVFRECIRNLLPQRQRVR